MAHDSGKLRALVAAVGGDFNAGGAAFAVCTEYLGGRVFAAQFGQGGRVCLAGALAGEAFVDVADTGFGADFTFGYIRVMKSLIAVRQSAGIGPAEARAGLRAVRRRTVLRRIFMR